MIFSYLVIGALALFVYVLTFRLSRKTRLVVALLIFGIGTAAFTIWIGRNLDDRPAPGDIPYHPSTQ
jgi:predicted MFS family arabinose efflux permease